MTSHYRALKIFRIARISIALHSVVTTNTQGDARYLREAENCGYKHVLILSLTSWKFMVKPMACHFLLCHLAFYSLQLDLWVVFSFLYYRLCWNSLFVLLSVIFPMGILLHFITILLLTILTFCFSHLFKSNTLPEFFIIRIEICLL